MSSAFNSNNPVDPLKLIRVAYSVNDTDRNPFNYCTSSGEVLESLTDDCTHITVPSGQPSTPFLIFPRGVLTNYRSKRGNGPHYPLDSICFLLERKDDSYTNYLQDVRKIGMTIVSLPDKKELVEYLMMANEEGIYAAVDKEAVLPVPLMLFPESPEALREQEQKATISGNKRHEVERRKDGKKAGKDEENEKEEDEDSERTRKSVKLTEGQKIDSSIVRPIQPTEAIFHCDKDFSSVSATFKNYLATSLNVTSSRSAGGGGGSLLDQISSMNKAAVSPASKRGSSSATAPVWIIIVPAGSAALLTLHNVKDFLMDSKYISVDEARKRGPKPPSVRFEHSGQSFEIVDNPARLSLSDWSRLLACFTLTSTWQFKGWKWETPLELFQHIAGFHVYFDDAILDSTVAGWNVTTLPLSRNKRHLDATAVMAFWTKINESIKTRLSKK